MKTANKILIAGLILLLAAVTAFLVIFRVHMQREIILPSGQITTVERELPPFTGIEIHGNMKVNLQAGGEHKVLITTDDNLVELIRTEVVSDVLKVHIQERIGKPTQMDISLGFSVLETIVSQAGAELISDEFIVQKKFAVHAMGGSSVKLALETEELTLRSHAGALVTVCGQSDILIAESLAGSTIEAEELQTRVARIETHAGSTNKLFVTGELTVRATTGSTVIYTGNPGITRKESNTGASITAR